MKKLKQIFIYRFFHRIVNTNRSSRWFGCFANTHLYKPLLKLLIKQYILFFKIDIDEFEFDFNTISTFNVFFTRKLKQGRRNWGKGICSPVDGRILSFGNVESGQIFQVKGKTYSEEEFTGQEPFSEGSYITLYLSPGDYHRVHVPFDMRIKKIVHIPGKLYSVSLKNTMDIDGLYCKNERVILSGHSEYGNFNFVFVGALNVGSIKLSFLPDFKTNIRKAQMKTKAVDFNLAKGEELGYFEMGSTIVMLLDNDLLSKTDTQLLDRPITLGESLEIF